MTYITAPSLAKPAPVVNGKAHPQEHVIQMRVVNRTTRVHRVPVRVLGPPLFIFAVITLVALAALGLLLTILPNLTLTTTTTRYQGFCTIPIKEVPSDPAFYEQPSYKVMPLRWGAEPDVQVLSAADDAASDHLVAGLREHLDIGDSVEKISVLDNGRHVNFIHDFEANITGIVDAERCFVTELDRESVLAPELLVLSIEGGAAFDMSRVRSTLRAALPALYRAAPALHRACRAKPTYRLHKEDRLVVRKRSADGTAEGTAEGTADGGADGPGHDYIQFAGRGVQEIQISNLADLLQAEQDAASR